MRCNSDWISACLAVASIASMPILARAADAVAGIQALVVSPSSVVVTGVSADGAVVAGYYFSPIHKAFRWTEAEGVVTLPQGPYLFTYAEAISPNGQVIVGDATPLEWLVPVRWSPREGVALVQLPSPYYYGWALGAADGAIVGFADTFNPFYPHRQAFRWTRTGTQLLGLLDGGFTSTAYGVSANELTVVGSCETAEGVMAFRWTAEDGMVDLGDLPGGEIKSIAYAASDDGSVIVGYSKSENGNEAFQWTLADGMVGLGNVSAGFIASTARDVSADGSIIVGGSSAGPFMWDAHHGMRSLPDVAESVYQIDLRGWTLGSAIGVSADGGVIVGSGSGSKPDSHVFRVVIPPIRSADLNHDGAVNGIDLGHLLAQWTGASLYSPCPPLQDGDLNSNCRVDDVDLGLLLGAWQ